MYATATGHDRKSATRGCQEVSRGGLEIYTFCAIFKLSLN